MRRSRTTIGAPAGHVASFADGRAACSCGWSSRAEDLPEARRAHVRHVELARLLVSQAPGGAP